MKRKITAILLVVALAVSLGLVPATQVMAAEFYVGSGQTYATIQAAIDAAGADDTIVVHSGTYPEDLTIPASKTNLELKPNASDVVTIKGVSTLAWGNWPLAAPNIEILASGVKIHGFTIESPSVAATDYSSGIVLDGEDIEIYDNSFVAQGAAAGGSVAIQTYRDNVLGYNSDISGLEIHDNDFSETSGGEYVGVFINHTLTGTGTVYVQDNTFSGGIYQGIVTERSNTVIKGNTIEGSSVHGIIVMDWDSRVQANVEISCNIVSGFDYGILIGHSGDTQTLTDIDVTYNRVYGNDVGIKVRSSAGGVVVNYNNITGNITYGVENTTTTTLDAENNWWGDSSGPYYLTTNPDGLGDAVSDNVDYEPWLTVPWGSKAFILKDSGVPGKGLDNAPGQQKPFNPKSRADDHAGKKPSNPNSQAGNNAGKKK